MIAPASDEPVLEICSVPMASVEAVALARSASNCLMSLLARAEENSFGGGSGFGSGAAILTGTFVLPPSAAAGPPFFSVLSLKKLSPAAAGASVARDPREGGGASGAAFGLCLGWAGVGGGLGFSCFLVWRVAPIVRSSNCFPISVLERRNKEMAMTSACRTIETKTPVRSFFLTLEDGMRSIVAPGLGGADHTAPMGKIAWHD